MYNEVQLNVFLRVGPEVVHTITHGTVQFPTSTAEDTGSVAIYIHMRVHVYMCVCVRASVLVCVCMRTCTCACTRVYIHASVHTCMCICVCVCVHAYVCVFDARCSLIILLLRESACFHGGAMFDGYVQGMGRPRKVMVLSPMYGGTSSLNLRMGSKVAPVEPHMPKV